MIGVSTVNPPSAATAVEAAGMEGKVKIYGMGLPKQNAGFVKRGTMQGLMLWDPRKMTYAAVNIALDYVLDGSLPTGGREAFGWAGIFRIDQSTKTAMVPSLVFTRENVDMFDF